MATIYVEPAALPATAKLLLQLVSNPDHVKFLPHTENGPTFVVPDRVAESFVLAVEALDREDEPEPEQKSKRKAKGN